MIFMAELHEEFNYIKPEEMEKVEKDAIAKGITVETMMEKAGLGIAQQIEMSYGPVKDKNIIMIIGSGNNGGDGSVAAKYLSEMGAHITAIILVLPALIRTPEAKSNWDKLTANKLVADTPEELYKYTTDIKNADIIVEAILGTGVKGEIKEPYASAIKIVSSSNAIKVAVDIPAGLDPGTGIAANPTLRADMTVTLYRPKIGLMEQRYYTGRIVVVPIGVE
jgi:hydroxyethylthiazole kinase-like uncharacterized protein yjeF